MIPVAILSIKNKAVDVHLDLIVDQSALHQHLDSLARRRDELSQPRHQQDFPPLSKNFSLFNMQ